MTLADRLCKHGGMISTGQGLGVMVAPGSAIGNCPPGWVFVAQDDPATTPEIVREALSVGRDGRKAWPLPEGRNRGG